MQTLTHTSLYIIELLTPPSIPSPSLSQIRFYSNKSSAYLAPAPRITFYQPTLLTLYTLILTLPPLYPNFNPCSARRRRTGCCRCCSSNNPPYCYPNPNTNQKHIPCPLPNYNANPTLYPNFNPATPYTLILTLPPPIP